MSTPATAPTEWRLTSADEFDGAELDPTKWNPYYSSVRRLAQPEDARARYRIADSILRLRLEATRPPPNLSVARARVSSIQTADWPTADGAATRVMFAQRGGWFEVRSRMPAGSGLHSAFWLYAPRQVAADAPARREVVEIDIYEQLGARTAAGVNNFAIHFTDESGKHLCDLGFDPSKDFHDYALDWREDRMQWHVDGQLVWDYRGPVPQEPLFILLGLYEGCGWTGAVDPQMAYPREFEIDHVRVYVRTGTLGDG